MEPRYLIAPGSATTLDALRRATREALSALLLELNPPGVSNSATRLDGLFPKALRNLIMPDLLREYAGLDPRLFHQIKSVDPDFWGRLPRILLFGYEQGKVWHQLRDPDPDRTSILARSSALLNLVVVLFDYLQDEVQAGALSEKVPETVVRRSLTGTGARSLSDLKTRIGQTGDPMHRVLLSGILAWLNLLSAQIAPGASPRSTSAVRQQVLDMYEAQRWTRPALLNQLPPDQQDQVGRRKAAGPSLVVAKTSLVVFPSGDGETDRKGLHLADRTGAILGLLDDLCDWSEDLARGTINGVNRKAMRQNPDNRISPEALRNSANLALGQLRAWFGELPQRLTLVCSRQEAREQYLGWLKTWSIRWLDVKEPA